MKLRKFKVTTTLFIAAAIISIIQSGPLAVQGGQATNIWAGVYTEEQAKRGEEIYGSTCQGCHGIDLSGVDEATPLAGTAFTANWDDQQLSVLSERIRVTMPPNKPNSISRDKIADLIAYILKMNRFPAGKSELTKEIEALKQIKFTAEKPK